MSVFFGAEWTEATYMCKLIEIDWYMDRNVKEMCLIRIYLFYRFDLQDAHSNVHIVSAVDDTLTMGWQM